MPKYIWSDRYGKDPKEGIHKYLQKVIPNYKRSEIDYYIKGFNLFIGKPDVPNSSKLASNNFEKFIKFINQLKQQNNGNKSI